jgi:serine/threonine-protein kinase
VTRDVRGAQTGPTATPNGRYRIVSDLGVGAFGNVCLAEDEATGHEVAIRFLPRGLASVPNAAQARQRTGGSLVAASEAHAALVRVLEVGDAENGHAFVAMELVQGRRLSEILSEGPLDVQTALRLAIDLGGAVETLHSLGLVHGALRPRNVMVGKDGGVKLMDVELIGLRDAWAMKGLIAEESPPEYLSPEQISGLPATDASDVYAFAAILYEMLCGKPPFQAETREAVLGKHLAETPIPMRRRRRTVPGSLESVVALALSKPPNLRPSIQNVLNHLWEEANNPATRWKRKAVIVGGAALAASIAVGGAWALLAPFPSAPLPLARPVPPPAAERAPASVPAPSAAPSTEVRQAPTLATPIPAVIPPSALRTRPPSAPPPVSTRPRAERREQPPAPQVPADSPREQAAAPNREANSNRRASGIRAPQPPRGGTSASSGDSQDVGNPHTGHSVPERRDGPLFRVAAKNSPRFIPQAVRIPSHKDIRSESHGHRTLGVLPYGQARNAQKCCFLLDTP